MANVDRPSGFSPVRHLNGNPWNGQFNMYYVASGNVTALYIGDPVRTAGAADTLGKYATMQQAAAGEAVRGIVIGFSNTPHVAADVTNLSRAYRPGETAMYVAVVDDPDVIFEIQEDSLTATNLLATDVGMNVDFVSPSSGSTSTGLSNFELNSDSASASVLPCRLLGLVDRPDNVLGDYARWNILFVEHEFRGTAGI